MDIAGHWVASIASPMGPIRLLLDLDQTGDQISGTAFAPSQNEKVSVNGGRIDGDVARFSIDVTKPMKFTFNAEVRVTGDSMTGKAKPGMMPGAKLTATRSR